MRVVLINSGGEWYSFTVYTLYTLNILQFYLSVISQKCKGITKNTACLVLRYLNSKNTANISISFLSRNVCTPKDMHKNI